MFTQFKTGSEVVSSDGEFYPEWGTSLMEVKYWNSFTEVRSLDYETYIFSTLNQSMTEDKWLENIPDFVLDYGVPSDIYCCWNKFDILLFVICYYSTVII